METITLFAHIVVVIDVFLDVGAKTTFLESRLPKDALLKVLEHQPRVKGSLDSEDGNSPTFDINTDVTASNEQHKPLEIQRDDSSGQKPQLGKEIPDTETDDNNGRQESASQRLLGDGHTADGGTQTVKGEQTKHLVEKKHIDGSPKGTIMNITRDTVTLNQLIEKSIHTFLTRHAIMKDFCKERQDWRQITFSSVIQCYVMKSHTALSDVKLLNKGTTVADADDSRLLLQLVGLLRSLSYLSTELSKLAKGRETEDAKPMQWISGIAVKEMGEKDKPQKEDQMVVSQQTYPERDDVVIPSTSLASSREETTDEERIPTGVVESLLDRAGKTRVGIVKGITTVTHIVGSGQAGERELMPGDGQAGEQELMPRGGQSGEQELMPGDGQAREQELMPGDGQAGERELMPRGGQSGEQKLMPGDGQAGERELMPRGGQSGEQELMPGDGQAGERELMPRGGQAGEQGLMLGGGKAREQELMPRGGQAGEQELMLGDGQGAERELMLRGGQAGEQGLMPRGGRAGEQELMPKGGQAGEQDLMPGDGQALEEVDQAALRKEMTKDWLRSKLFLLKKKTKQS